jgi:hypothetical protein
MGSAGHALKTPALRNSNHFLSQSEYPFTITRIALQNYYVFNYGMKTGERYCCEVDSVADLKHLSYLIAMILPFKVANDL